MKKLTKDQLEAILNLEDSPLIHSVSVSRENGMNRVTIESAVGVEWDGPCGVDSLLVRELDELLPDLEYMGSPANHTNPMTGIDEDIYFINFQGETLIWLIMQLGRKDESNGSI